MEEGDLYSIIIWPCNFAATQIWYICTPYWLNSREYTCFACMFVVCSNYHWIIWIKCDKKFTFRNLTRWRCFKHEHWGLESVTIDHMHMTSQKGAQLHWGSNETLPRASSPSMQPGGQTLQATPPGWPARARALRGWVPMRTASTTRARCATLVWRRCYGDVTLCDVNA